MSASSDEKRFRCWERLGEERKRSFTMDDSPCLFEVTLDEREECFAVERFGFSVVRLEITLAERDRSRVGDLEREQLALLVISMEALLR